jgi:hypothetical protein
MDMGMLDQRPTTLILCRISAEERGSNTTAISSLAKTVTMLARPRVQHEGEIDLPR